MLTNEQWKEIVDVLDDVTDEGNEYQIKMVRQELRKLVDKEPFRQAVIKLMIDAEDLGLEVIPDEESGEITIWTGTVFPASAETGTYSEIVFMSEADDTDSE